VELTPPTVAIELVFETHSTTVELIDSILADLMAHEAALLDTLAPWEQEDLRRILKRLLTRFEPLSPDDSSRPDGSI
jgi:hypothetical protein